MFAHCTYRNSSASFPHPDLALDPIPRLHKSTEGYVTYVYFVAPMSTSTVDIAASIEIATDLYIST